MDLLAAAPGDLENNLGEQVLDLGSLAINTQVCKSLTALVT